jgi:anti-anti-sigma regulatory factor
MLMAVRAHGTAGAPGVPSLSDHACWAYGDDGERDAYRSGAVAFMADGLALGQRLVYVADRRVAEPLDLSSLGDVATMTERGELVVHDLADLAAGDGPVQAERQLAALVASVDAALDTGWSGVRVVSEMTAQLSRAEWCATHVAYEQQLDRTMVDRPLAALCAYDERVIGAEAARSVACVHPFRYGGGATFGLYATSDGVALEGEVDACQAPLLARALASLPPQDPLVVDAGEATFLDAAATGVIARYAAGRQAAGAEVCVREAGPMLRRLYDLLGPSISRSLRFL